jgi:hypothetical protein
MMVWNCWTVREVVTAAANSNDGTAVVKRELVD